ncbi:hypothetical protein XENOCAPTIV_019603 [Xenoophorus captivus]|uniref:Uncharacterized protein n=1 Tax=Xenoophorus captivus TaxID=1517983 RepID=A0ABV0RZJ7_9TELE
MIPRWRPEADSSEGTGFNPDRTGVGPKEIPDPVPDPVLQNFPSVWSKFSADIPKVVQRLFFKHQEMEEQGMSLQLQLEESPCPLEGPSRRIPEKEEMAAELFSTSLPHGEEEEEEEEVETKTNFIQLSEPEQSAERNDDQNAVHVNNNNDNEDGGEERHSWQGAHPTLRERNALMFNNEHMADIHFIVGPPGETQTIPAHKVQNLLYFDPGLLLLFSYFGFSGWF